MKAESRKAEQVRASVLRVRYSCPACGLDGVRCDVTPRGDEDVVTWMHGVTVELSRDHARRSPDCHPTELKDLWIPVEGTERIGDLPMVPDEPQGDAAGVRNDPGGLRAMESVPDESPGDQK